MFCEVHWTSRVFLHSVWTIFVVSAACSHQHFAQIVCHSIWPKQRSQLSCSIRFGTSFRAYSRSHRANGKVFAQHSPGRKLPEYSFACYRKRSAFVFLRWHFCQSFRSQSVCVQYFPLNFWHQNFFGLSLLLSCCALSFSNWVRVHGSFFVFTDSRSFAIHFLATQPEFAAGWFEVFAPSFCRLAGVDEFFLRPKTDQTSNALLCGMA